MPRKKAQQKVAIEPMVEITERLSLSDEAVELSFSYYFNWGYPDYIACALKLLFELSDPSERQILDADLSWSRLRALLERAESEQVKYLIASNPETPQCVLDYLSKQETLSVTERVAEHPSAHPSTLSALACHKAASVRVAVAENGNSSTETFETLCRDSNADVRYRLAENFNTPEDILKFLADDDNPYVGARAQQTLDRLTGAEIIEGHFAEMRGHRSARKVSG